MDRHIVVAFRMPPAGMLPGPEGPYLARARSMRSRGEALGGRLVAWSAALFAIAWDDDSVEEAVLFATSISDRAVTVERAWSCGIAEGELEELAPDGQRMHLAWGEALLAASGLARVANAGEVLVDGDVRALRAGQLSLVGARSSTDSGRRVRGWRLDIDRPWKRGVEGLKWPEETPSRELDLAIPGPNAAAEFLEEVSTSEVLGIIEAVAPLSAMIPAAAENGAPAEDAHVYPERAGTLADRVRALTLRESNSDPVVALADLRRARAQAGGGPPTIRCQLALALAVALSIAGRAEEALLDALDALACAREAREPKAIGACIALLARLYESAGFPDAGGRLRVDAT